MSIESAQGESPNLLSRLLAWRQAWLTMDTNERVVEFAASCRGIIAVHAGFILTLAISLNMSTPLLALTSVAFAGCALWPQRRKLIVSGAGLVYLTLRPFRIDDWTQTLQELSSSGTVPISPMALQIVAVGGFLLLAWAALQAQHRFSASVAAKRPVRTLLVTFFVVVALACLLPPGSWSHIGLWSVIGVWASSFWFLSYALADQKSGDPTANVQRLGLIRPFWGGSAAPIGKGFGYLSKFEAKDDTELAVTRLKALKLIVWAAILNTAYLASAALLHDAGAVPTLHNAILLQAEGGRTPLAMRWVSLLSNYFLDLLVISVWGHAIVAVVRMIGYRIPRNTCNPMASRSLAEFWNRYFFYFKEMLVDFFFYPAFLRHFKKQPKLRIAFATLCAAGIGNFLYHFMRETHVFAATPILETLPRFTSAAFYSLVLAVGLIASQLRGAKPQPADGFWAYQVRPRIGVLLFFCLLKIFDDISGEGSFGERLTFLVRLFGV